MRRELCYRSVDESALFVIAARPQTRLVVIAERGPRREATRHLRLDSAASSSVGGTLCALSSGFFATLKWFFEDFFVWASGSNYEVTSGTKIERVKSLDERGRKYFRDGAFRGSSHPSWKIAWFSTTARRN